VVAGKASLQPPLKINMSDERRTRLVPADVSHSSRAGRWKCPHRGCSPCLIVSSKSQPKRRLAMGESGKKDKGNKEQKKKPKLNPKEKKKLKQEKKKNK
jgi:hypothetical protein